jgi:predicted dehydrogenase
MALRAGKGVLVEKPFAMNLREAEQVVTLARSRRLFLMEAMWTRYLPAFDEVRRIVASGEIGTVRQVVPDFGFTANFGAEHRVFNPELGGGALLDLGIYPLSIASALLGPVTEIRAQASALSRLREATAASTAPGTSFMALAKARAILPVPRMPQRTAFAIGIPFSSSVSLDVWDGRPSCRGKNPGPGPATSRARRAPARA